mmetsp:Transcript_45127/g.88290  ORF Transcript_45127/g.88290 Transcript_45127/m.88290 type:complete len:107 (-) Transcript_45127:795-1115(-)
MGTDGSSIRGAGPGAPKGPSGMATGTAATPAIGGHSYSNGVATATANGKAGPEVPKGPARVDAGTGTTRTRRLEGGEGPDAAWKHHLAPHFTKAVIVVEVSSVVFD